MFQRLSSLSYHAGGLADGWPDPPGSGRRGGSRGFGEAEASAQAQPL